ncbi:MAG: hypothetical protein FJ026_15495, partial [Chloroflexi bacterium]|nr:hypothetical protein [Chloroflexota bacterium]
NTLLIEAAFGLGENVVRGETEVDRYVVRRETGQESEPPVIAHKQSQHILAPGGGLQPAEVPAEQRDARVLGSQQVQQLTATILALERTLGGPQDVEWAWAGQQLYLLQSRPITTQPEDFFTELVTEEDSTWTSGFLNERFPLPVSPLGWSVVQELLEELAFRDPLRYLGTPHLDRLRITRLYRGHPYVNMFVFQTLYRLFPDSLLPEDASRYFPAGKTELRHRVSYPSSLFDPRFLCSMLRHLARTPRVWSPWHNDRVWARFVLDHDRRSQELETQWLALQKDSPSTERIWAAIAAAQELNRELLSLHRWSLTIADLAYTLLRRLLRAWARAEEWLSLCTHLVTGLPNKSLQVDHALRRLAEIQDPAAFDQALLAFLAAYGHRSFCLDIHHPTFAEEPDQVVELVRRVRSSLEGEEKVVTARRDAGAEEARIRARQLCGSGPAGWAKRAAFDQILNLTRRYMPLREDQRFYWQRTLAQMRRFFLLMGRCMAADQVIAQAEDIFFLTKAEVEAYALGHSSGKGYKALTGSRKQQFAQLGEEFRAAPDWAYPPFLQGNQPLQVQSPAHVQLRGRAVSPGLARGPVVVLLSPAELGRVRAGDILVTRSVDPGWTPIFALLSALVVEYGGQLSHAAVVAREYGLPMVAGVTGATRLLHNGDQVVVDGLNGIVAKA